MSSLKRRPGSPYFVACYAKAGGERIQVSTKQKSRDAAMKVLLAFVEAEEHARRGTLTEATARRIISHIVERTAGEPLQFYTAETWFREWVAGKGQTKSAGTHERYAHVIEGFLAHLGKRAQLNLQHLTPKDVSSFRTKELTAGKSPKTANLAVKTISAGFNAALRQGYLPSNPARALDSLKHTATEKGMFTQEQVEALLAVAPPDWRGAILFAYYTGARLQDVANMRWSAIDLAARTIRFFPMKTPGKEVLIPLHPTLEEHLLAVASTDTPEACLFPALAGRKPGGAHGLSMTFAKLMGHAGIATGAARPRSAGGRAISHLSFHSFRHGFNSAMANGGVSQEIRQKLTGHSSPEMNKNYTHHELAPLRGAVNVIPALKSR